MTITGLVPVVFTVLDSKSLELFPFVWKSCYQLLPCTFFLYFTYKVCHISSMISYWKYFTISRTSLTIWNMNSLTVEGEAKTKVDFFHFEATSLNLCRYLSFLKIYFIVIKIKSFNTIHRQELNNPFFLEWFKTRWSCKKFSATWFRKNTFNNAKTCVTSKTFH